ncbi:MAG: LysR family transcriptional regulator [Rhizobiaceae bacterium]|nr:LysR family transcriptional regulator [Rhizobiaceae bacterium]
MNTHNSFETGLKPGTQVPLLDLDLLKTIVAISETGNFSTAAELVHRTPSAISMQVKRIEEMLKRPIFVRAARTVTLNEDGEILVAHARRVLALNREIVAKFIAPDVSGIVRLGAVDHVTEQFLPSVLCRFNDTHPGVKVDVTVENSDTLAQKYRVGKLDIVLVTCETSIYAGLDVEILYREGLAWAGLKGGIACEQNPLPVSVWEEGCVWRKAGLSGLEKQGRDYRVTFKSAYISGQRAGILADLAVAPLPISACVDPIIALGPECGLPDLPEYAIGMLTNSDATPSVKAVADQLRANFSNAC